MANNIQDIENNLASDRAGMPWGLSRSGVRSGFFFSTISGITTFVGSTTAGAFISSAVSSDTKQALASVLNCCWRSFCQGRDYSTTISCSDYLEVHTHLIFECMKELTNSSAEFMCKAANTSTSQVTSSIFVAPLILGATTAAVMGLFGYFSKRILEPTQFDNQDQEADNEDTPLFANNS